jgi:dienelactone hydrolase
MKTKAIVSLLLLGILLLSGVENSRAETNRANNADDVKALKNLLIDLKTHTSQSLFALHYQSMLNVIEAKGKLTKTDSSLLAATLPCFNDSSFSGNGSFLKSYTDRQRPLVISWVSPTDGHTSFLKLRLPKNWNPDKLYPLYIELHGLWDVANNPIDFMTYSFRNGPASSFAFEDGYYITPLGRVNLWYEGISETDIWEGIDKIESLLQVDQSRKYLTGHSMGGYGAWSIASKTPHVWAAIGIHAGALDHFSIDCLSDVIITKLKSVPVYFVVGLKDVFYNINLSAYLLLHNAGNENTKLVTFDGGHDYLIANVENMYKWLKDFVNNDYLAYNQLKVKGKNALLISPVPVRNQATIRINLKKQSHVLLNLYDMNGRVADTLVNGELKSGETIINWQRKALAAGIYSWIMISDRQKIKGKLTLY